MPPETSHESLFQMPELQSTPRSHEPELASWLGEDVGSEATARSATPTESTISSLYRQHSPSARGSRVTVSSSSPTVQETSSASPEQDPEQIPETFLYDTARPSESTTSAIDTSSNGRVTDFQRQKIKAATILSEVTGILVPLCFIGFAVAIILLQDTGTDTAAQYTDAITVLATIFPIVFAVVVGQLMTHIVRWRLETGARLRSLEQLLASRTVGGAVLSIFTLPLGWLHILLLFLWAFSPLGAQSMLRMLGTRLQGVETNTTVIYFDTNTDSMLHSSLVSTLQNNPVGGPSIIASIYRASLLSSDSVKADSLDLWGNLKVPFLAHDGNVTAADWQSLSSRSTLQHSSLVGLPLQGIAAGNSTFEMESSYVELQYETKEFGTTNKNTFSSKFLNEDIWRNSLQPVPNGTWQGYNLIKRNVSDGKGINTAMWTLGLNAFVNENWTNGVWAPDDSLGRVYQLKSPVFFANRSNIQPVPTRLRLEIEVFGSSKDAGGGEGYRYLTAYFKVHQRYVRSRVRCSQAGVATDSDPAQPKCRVVAQRPSTWRNTPADISSLSIPNIFAQVSGSLPSISGFNYATSDIPDTSIAYLADDKIRSYSNPSALNSIIIRKTLLTVPGETLSVRLGQLINTYLLVGQTYPIAMTGSVDPDTRITDSINTTAAVTNLQEVYQVSAHWMALFILSSAVMLGAGIINIVLGRAAWVPELLGYASTVLRDSKFVELDADDGRLDGMDLTNKYGEKRVKYGFTGHTAAFEEKPLLGVGWESEIRGIRQ
ncbi:hypothetical protein PspLS_03662 [Pyricularia sp. CBS 133598]|nr:hypothetical protein PspLS_03662 [Pyricularia sp. CBS 133598]